MDHNSFKITAVCLLNDRDRSVIVDSESFRLRMPEDCVKIQFGDGGEGYRQRFKIYEKVECYIIIKNPLPVNLEHLTLTIEGTGIEESSYNVPDLVIKPGDEKKLGPLEILPTRRGKITVYVDVDCQQMENIKCSGVFVCA